MNNLFGYAVDQFERDYPGVYAAYLSKCDKLSAHSGDEKASCCTFACDVCKTANCSGGVDGCITNCPPDDLGNIPTGEDNSGVFRNCVDKIPQGKCTGMDDSNFKNCYTQKCNNDVTCASDNDGWFHNYCTGEGDWPGHTNVQPIQPDNGPNYGPDPNVGPGPNYGPDPNVGPGPNYGPDPNVGPGPNYGPDPNVGPNNRRVKPVKPINPINPPPKVGMFANLTTPQVVGISIGAIIILVLLIMIIRKLSADNTDGYSY
jgi:hypothetical protein